ncbi:hypothetical protein BDW62DRAFT_202035 [Aspergillus aurantiobrunneus]
MCVFWTVKYLCNCIYDEWYFPCDWYGLALLPREPKTWCYLRHMQETTDVLTLCEECFAMLDSQVRKHGVKKVLQSAETFPLAEQLGMLIVLENDEGEQWKAFRKKPLLFFENEWQIPETDGPVDGRRLRLKCPKKMGEGDASKY